MVSRYDREREAGDEEAQRSGGQTERRDPSQGQRAHAEKRGHRSSKATDSDVKFSTESSQRNCAWTVLVISCVH